MKIIKSFFFLILFTSLNLKGYPWPVKDQHVQHKISGVIGEMRVVGGVPDHFHAGVDIPWPQGDSVFAVDSGIYYPGDSWIGRFRYVHVSFVFPDTDTVSMGDFIGLVDYPTSPHIHLREAPHATMASRDTVLNPLRKGIL